MSHIAFLCHPTVGHLNTLRNRRPLRLPEGSSRTLTREGLERLLNDQPPTAPSSSQVG
ncbi:MAG: hypothetical protein JXB05_21470 [Myxococcaceae bacterium]|nr:hypothetical protein [Myxococcaceae bacterium]